MKIKNVDLAINWNKLNKFPSNTRFISALFQLSKKLILIIYF